MLTLRNLKKCLGILLSLSFIQPELAFATSKSKSSKRASQQATQPPPMAAMPTQAQPPSEPIEPVEPSAPQEQNPVIIPALHFKPFAVAHTREEGQATINAAQMRPFAGLNSPQDEADFTNLVHANHLIDAIDEPMEFLSWFLASQPRLIDEFQSQVTETVSWEAFVTALYVKYMIDTKPPETVWQSLYSKVAGTVLKWRSSVSYTVVAYVFYQIGGMAKGGMISGPVAGGWNSYLAQLMAPFHQKLFVKGVQRFGKTGKWLYSVLFKIHSAVQFALRVVLGGQYSMSHDQFTANVQAAFDHWNEMNMAYSGQPPGLTSGRALFLEYGVFRLRDLDTALKTAVNGAELNLQGAEQIIYNIMNRNPSNGTAIYQAGNNLLVSVGEEFAQSEELTASSRLLLEPSRDVKLFQDFLAAHGGMELEIDRLTECYRRVYVFTRSAATVLAMEKVNNVHSADMIHATRGVYERLRLGTLLEYFDRQLKYAVRDILESMDIQISVAEKEIEAEEAAETREQRNERPSEDPMLKIIQGINGSPEGIHAAEEPGGLGRSPEPASAAEHVQQEIRTGGRR